jgi:hypothetical protein
MDRQRSLGVKEARLGLSLLTGLLVVFGYLALQRLGGTGQAPPVEIRDDARAGPLTGVTGSRGNDPNELHVLPAHEPDPAQAVPHTSHLPNWTPLPRLDIRDELERNETESLWPLPPVATEDIRPAEKRTR